MRVPLRKFDSGRSDIHFTSNAFHEISARNYAFHFEGRLLSLRKRCYLIMSGVQMYSQIQSMVLGYIW